MVLQCLVCHLMLFACSTCIAHSRRLTSAVQLPGIMPFSSNQATTPGPPISTSRAVQQTQPKPVPQDLYSRSAINVCVPLDCELPRTDSECSSPPKSLIDTVNQLVGAREDATDASELDASDDSCSEASSTQQDMAVIEATEDSAPPHRTAEEQHLNLLEALRSTPAPTTLASTRSELLQSADEFLEQMDQPAGPSLGASVQKSGSITTMPELAATNNDDDSSDFPEDDWEMVHEPTTCHT